MSNSKIVNIEKIKNDSQNYIDGTIKSINIGDIAHELYFEISYKNREDLEEDLLCTFDIRERYLESFIEDNLENEEDDDEIIITISDNAALYFIEKYFNVKTSYHYKLDDSKENIIFE